jgi:hypothetical protein
LAQRFGDKEIKKLHGFEPQTFKFETHYEPHVKAHEEKLDLDVEVKKNNRNSGIVKTACQRKHSQGATTLSIMTFIIMILSIATLHNYAECRGEIHKTLYELLIMIIYP